MNRAGRSRAAGERRAGSEGVAERRAGSEGVAERRAGGRGPEGFGTGEYRISAVGERPVRASAVFSRVAGRSMRASGESSGGAEESVRAITDQSRDSFLSPDGSVGEGGDETGPSGGIGWVMWGNGSSGRAAVRRASRRPNAAKCGVGMTVR
ncbi:hypothetical protein Axi01nite_26390 [Actinoplanes xinjiangensis]|nr:hypothetical protein Axi01nite_26390 [Actinoplanes xinjiangensis]